MKIQQRIVAICAAAFLLADSLPMHMVRADQVLEETVEQERTAASEQEATEQGRTEALEREFTEPSEQDPAEQERTEPSEQEPAEQERTEPSEQESTERESTEVSEQDPTEQERTEASEQDPTEQEHTEPSREETGSSMEDEAADMPQQETIDASEDETTYPVPDEPPAFEAHIENRMGYTVIGTFTDFTPDIARIDTLYSLDGESWRAVTGGDWNLYGLDSDDNDTLYMLQNQSCVYNAYEPMKSYTTGGIERFYLKLRITKKNGLTYDSQLVTIEQGGIRPIPEGTTRYACFSSELIVRESVADYPYRFRMYGRYQISVPAGTTVEEITALLPETLPVEIQLIGRDLRVNGVIDCPVTWKQLSLSQLPAGETITIPDAAEEIIVPAGTQLSTPLGIFVLDEPLRVDNPPTTDEVRLVINVSPEDRALAGVLKQAPDGLMAALEPKPTGATAIETYVLTEGESEWTEIPGLSLLKEMNFQHSTENSGFALVLYNDQEPYRSYLEAQKAGTDPVPFFICLKIKGGIYDDRQLVLAWPDIYEELPDLPKVGRSEGNEGNAGADNKNDSTESGQRPNLPVTPDEKQEEPLSQPAVTLDEKQEEPSSEAPVTSDEKQEEPLSQPPVTLNEKQEEPSSEAPVTPDEKQEKPDAGHQAHNGSPKQSDTVAQKPASAETGQRPNLPQPAQNTKDIPHEEQSDAVSQKSSPIQSSVVVQAAAPRTDNDNAVVRPGTETVMEHTAENGARISIQTLTAATVTGLLIGAVVCNAAGCNLLDRVVVIIRNVMC